MVTPSTERLRRSRHLACPSVSWTGAQHRRAFVIDKIARAERPPFDTIGLEVRVAFVMMSRLTKVRTAGGGLRKSRELCLRPAAEPLILAYWDRLKRFEMTDEQIAALCSMLHGSKQIQRTKDSYGLWKGADVRFEPAEQARTWWADIQSVANNPELDSLLPTYAFARTIFAHPFPDGNGRLARALVHGALARTGSYHAPCLPLAPAFYMNGAKVADALRRLSDDADWSAFNSVFRSVLDDAVRLSRLAAH